MLKLWVKVLLKNVKLFKCIALAVVLVGIILVPVLKTSAQSNGLGITPELSYTVNAGSQRSDTLYVNNLSTSQPLNLKLGIVDFKPMDETGTPKILQASDAPQTPWSLKPYVTLPDYITIDPGKSKLIPFTIKIPASLGAGSYYSAVQYSATGSNNKEKVNVAASADTLLFVTIPGKATEQLNLVQFGAEAGGNFRSIFRSAPNRFAYRIKDSGNLSESPAGSIVVKNIFGHVVAHIDSANPQSELVLIGQTRKFEVCNPKSTNQSDIGKESNCKALNIKPGMYSAEIELLYGQNGQASHQISAKATFWYLPLWFVAVFILVLLVVAYAIYYLYQKFSAARHRHKRR